MKVEGIRPDFFKPLTVNLNAEQTSPRTLCCMIFSIKHGTFSAGASDWDIHISIPPPSGFDSKHELLAGSIGTE